MNFVDTLVTLFLLTVMYLSAVKSAHIPKEEGSAHERVIAFMDVYNKSRCQPRELLVELSQEYPAEVEYNYVPSCVPLMRCSGCCNDEILQCMPTSTHNITIQLKQINSKSEDIIVLKSFTEHSACACSLKEQDKEQRLIKPRKGKGLKRKRKKDSDKQTHEANSWESFC